MSVAKSSVREDSLSLDAAALAGRFAVSAALPEGRLTSEADFESWFDRQRAQNRIEVGRIPFSALRSWGFDPATGNLRHDSGRFFSIEGLRVTSDWVNREGWSQPIISQPEVGVLGILVKEFDGVLHLLMQAKCEPGNIGSVQLSPTVQATRSNYRRVHQGSPVAYLEYFHSRAGSRVLVDVLQSEQGSWFLRKRNRNMVVEVTADVPDHPDFRWLTLGQVQRLLERDNVVNMDARTVLSCIPLASPDGAHAPDAYGDALLASLRPRGHSLHTNAEVLHWLTDIKAGHELRQEPIPLADVELWHRGDDAISHESGRYFDVIATEVTATSREVGSWTQPLLAPVGRGVIAFLARPIGGELHLLLNAKMEAGVLDSAELAPTVQSTPENYAGLPAARLPAYLADVVAGRLGRVRYDHLQSEEGGRFHRAENRYQIIEVGEDFPVEVPEDFRWVTPRQITSLLLYSNYLNVQARSLFACLHTTW